MSQNLYSHLTAKTRSSLSFPARVLVGRKLLVGNILDFGCGFGTDVQILQKRKLEIIGYDPHYFPKLSPKKFDTILCLYVLNVLLPQAQSGVLSQVEELLVENGKAYFAVRRDVQTEGFRMHKIHRKPTYQCNVELPYHSIFKNEFCEIYELTKSGQIASISNFENKIC
jgi:ATP adenylyltransferase